MVWASRFLPFICCSIARASSRHPIIPSVQVSLILGLMLPGMVSGYLKDMVGYRLFFIIVMACCAITFLVTAFLKIDPEFGKKEKEIKEEIEEEEMEVIE